MGAQDEARALYSDRTDGYHRFVSAVRYPQGLRAALRDWPPLRSDMKVLDAGCGGGLVTFALRGALASRGLRPGSTHAFDLTPVMLDRFRDELRRRGVTDVELRQADVLDPDALPPTWRGYDLIVSSAMLEYLPPGQLPTALRNLRARLAEGGVLLLFITRRNPLMRLLIGRWWRSQLYTRDHVARAFSEAGFTRVRFRRFPAAYRHLDLWGHFVEAAE